MPPMKDFKFRPILGAILILVSFPAKAYDFAAFEQELWLADTPPIHLEKEISAIIAKSPSSCEGHFLLSTLYTRIAGAKNIKDNEYKYRTLESAITLSEEMQYLCKGENEPLAHIALLRTMGLTGATERMKDFIRKNEAKLALEWRFWLWVGSHLPLEESMEYFKKAGERNAPKELLFGVLDRQMQKSENGISEYVISTLEFEMEADAFQYIKAENAELNRDRAKARGIYQILEKENGPLGPKASFALIALSSDLKTEKRRALALSENLEALSAPERNAAHLFLSFVFLADNNKEKAFAHYQRFLSTKNSDANLLLIWAAIKKLDISKSMYEDLANLLLSFETRAWAPVHMLLGDLAAAHNDLKKAREYYENASLMEPTNTQFLLALGLVLLKIGEFSKSLNSFDEALILSPLDPVILYNKACALAKLGRTEESLLSLAEATRLDPTLEGSAREDEDLRSLRSIPEFNLIFRTAVE